MPKVYGSFQFFLERAIILSGQKDPDFSKSTDVDTLMPFAFVAAMVGVGCEDVAVSSFRLFKDAAFGYNTWAAVIGETA